MRIQAKRKIKSYSRSAIAVCLLALSCVMALLVSVPHKAFATESATEYPTWTAVADAISEQLNTAQDAYSRGNTGGANSDFSAAYHLIYVSSNFTAVVSETISAERQQVQQQMFDELRNLSYTAGNDDQIAQGVKTLEADLKDAATELDANANLKKPAAYDAQLQAQISADRKKLDAAKEKNPGRGERSWTQVAQEMGVILDKAYQAHAGGDSTEGANLMNEAYYQYYEKLGFEKTVMAAISGQRVSEVEYQFKMTRQSINAGDPQETVRSDVDTLKAMLLEDAATLDGGAAGDINPFVKFVTSSFGQAFIILLREGLEAILVVAAIIAYLVKSGNKPMIKWIYLGMVVALIASGLVALLFNMLFQGNGPEQEIMEGVVALIAMGMLLYTSNWMLSRSSIGAWNSFIEGKTSTAVSTGSLVSLALLSFFAVFREGAETVLFYQAIFAMAPGDSNSVWLGFGAAAAILLVIFLLIRFTSVKIPIRPFFIITSVLMAVLVVIFAGGGVHAFIEGDLLAGRYVSGLPTSDWLGFYPYVETITAQTIALIVVVVLSVMAARLGRKGRIEH